MRLAALAEAAEQCLEASARARAGQGIGLVVQGEAVAERVPVERERGSGADGAAGAQRVVADCAARSRPRADGDGDDLAAAAQRECERRDRLGRRGRGAVRDGLLDVAGVAGAERGRRGGDLDLEQAGGLGRRRGCEQRHEIVGLVHDEAAVGLAELRDARGRHGRCRGQRLAGCELRACALGDAKEVGGVVHDPHRDTRRYDQLPWRPSGGPKTCGSSTAAPSRTSACPRSRSWRSPARAPPLVAARALSARPPHRRRLRSGQQRGRRLRRGPAPPGRRPRRVDRPRGSRRPGARRRRDDAARGRRPRGAAAGRRPRSRRRRRRAARHRRTRGAARRDRAGDRADLPARSAGGRARQPERRRREHGRGPRGGDPGRLHRRRSTAGSSAPRSSRVAPTRAPSSRCPSDFRARSSRRCPPSGVDVSDLASLPRRDPLGSKYDAGAVLIVGGAPGTSGAPLLAARAAFHAGAGVVFAAVSGEVRDQVAIGGPELMVHGTRDPDEVLALAGARRCGRARAGPRARSRRGARSSTCSSRASSARCCSMPMRSTRCAAGSGRSAIVVGRPRSRRTPASSRACSGSSARRSRRAGSRTSSVLLPRAAARCS